MKRLQQVVSSAEVVVDSENALWRSELVAVIEMLGGLGLDVGVFVFYLVDDVCSDRLLVSAVERGHMIAR